MYKGFILLCCSLISYSLFGQDKIDWTFDYNDQNETIEVKAKLSDGWHLYSQHIDEKVGPIPTVFDFKKNDGYQLVGVVREPKAIHEYDKNFGGEVTYFKDEVIFEQKIRVIQDTQVEGVVTFMLCDDYRCLPPEDLEFKIDVEN